MKKTIPVVGVVLVFVTGFSTLASAQTDRQIEAVRKLVQKTDEDIGKSEQEPEYSNISRLSWL